MPPDVLNDLRAQYGEEEQFGQAVNLIEQNVEVRHSHPVKQTAMWAAAFSILLSQNGTVDLQRLD